MSAPCPQDACQAPLSSTLDPSGLVGESCTSAAHGVMGLHREDSPVVGRLHVGDGWTPVSLLSRLSVSETDVVAHFSSTLEGQMGGTSSPHTVERIIQITHSLSLRHW